MNVDFTLIRFVKPSEQQILLLCIGRSDIDCIDPRRSIKEWCIEEEENKCVLWWLWSPANGIICDNQINDSESVH